jgi:hypothetical protein
MDKRIEGLLIRISEKLDTQDIGNRAMFEETRRSMEKMINSLDKLIYDHDYFGKNSPEIMFLKEIKMMLKDAIAVNAYTDIDCIKRRIDGMKLNQKARLRSSFSQSKASRS